MPQIIEILPRISRRFYRALERASLTDLNEISSKGIYLQRTPGIGRLGYEQICKAIEAYAVAKGVKFDTYPQHPLVKFGLHRKYAERLMLAEWLTVEDVIKQGEYVKRAGRIGNKGYAAVTAAIDAWRKEAQY